MRALKDLELNNKDLVAVSNRYALTRKMSLTPMATKLFVWCVSQIKKTDEEIVTFTLSADNFKKSFGAQNVRRDLDRITDELMNFQIYLENSETGSWEKVNVMSTCSYSPEAKEANLRFNKAAWHCFTNLNGGQFASGVLQIFTQINNPYAFNLYIFLHNHTKSGTTTIALEDFRGIIGAVATSYKKWAHLEAKVLKPLKKLFLEHSPIKFNYMPTGKVSRKYTKVKFYDIRKGDVQGQLLDERNPCVKVAAGDVPKDLISTKDAVNLLPDHLKPDNR